MSDADRKDFTYLYNTQGIEAAEQFLDSIRWGLNKQRNEAYENQRATDVRQSGWSAAGETGNGRFSGRNFGDSDFFSANLKIFLWNSIYKPFRLC